MEAAAAASVAAKLNGGRASPPFFIFMILGSDAVRIRKLLDFQIKTPAKYVPTSLRLYRKQQP